MKRRELILDGAVRKVIDYVDRTVPAAARVEVCEKVARIVRASVGGRSSSITSKVLLAAAENGFITKSAFAELLGVTPGRVSQMIAEGKISAEALTGSDNRSMINLELAISQISGALSSFRRAQRGIQAARHPSRATRKQNRSKR